VDLWIDMCYIKRKRFERICFARADAILSFGFLFEMGILGDRLDGTCFMKS
jgi:hypothetical protein